MPHVFKGTAVSLLKEIYSLDIESALGILSKHFPDLVAFSTSFSNEDQVITDLIAKSKTSVEIFTLDTGRLFDNTYSTWEATNTYYGIHIKTYHPDAQSLEDYLNLNGPNAFYQSVEKRKECCSIRKVEPLRRALKNNAVWITGIRAEHSLNRQQTSLIEWDETNQIIKYNPLLNWSTEDVKEYIQKYKIPYNPLSDNGYASIGCSPCTRAIKENEDIRAGRWWWEDNDKKECGLHIKR